MLRDAEWSSINYVIFINLTETLPCVLFLQATGRMLALVGDAAFRDILKLSMGRLLHMIAAEFDAAAEGAADRDAVRTASQSASVQPRMLLYSGHDTTLMPLLLALGQDLTDWPPYMSHLVRLPPPSVWSVCANKGACQPVQCTRKPVLERLLYSVAFNV